MKSYKKIIIWTLLANFFIVIVAGHGGATLGMMEGFIIAGLFDQSISRPIGEILLLLLSAALTCLGQVTLIISIFSKPKLSFRLKLIGTTFLIAGYGFLLAHFWTEPTIGISLVTGIPFVVLAAILFFKRFKTDNV